jgi:ethanolamine utilization cobalamin adenosyltransferase
MKIVTQADLRSLKLPADCKEYVPPPGAFLTPPAREYLSSRGIELRENAEGMPVTAAEGRGAAAFIDAETGGHIAQKGEDMTHLRANLLVSKSHPRIAFRGALDSLEADILEAQLLASGPGQVFFCKALGEALLLVRKLMSAEVNEQPLEQVKLFGLEADELHRQSHQVKDFFGFPHPVPEYRMGALPLRLNTLRTRVREVELIAVRTFSSAAGQGREDIVRALNRLSSALYWLFCRSLSEKNA